jgi:hypothetical protein
MNHVFGTQAFYHRKVMFAMLPDKRTLKGPTSISFIASPKDDDSKDPSWQMTQACTNQSVLLAGSKNSRSPYSLW